jgi:hypothetical protein
MKKLYVAPVLALSGGAVQETLNGVPNFGPESMTSRFLGAGALGYYL